MSKKAKAIRRKESCYQALSRDKARRKERCARADILFDDLQYCDGVQGLALGMIPYLYKSDSDGGIGSINSVAQRYLSEVLCGAEMTATHAPDAKPLDPEWEKKCRRVVSSVAFDYDQCVKGDGLVNANSTNLGDHTERAHLTNECKDIMTKLKETKQTYIKGFDYPISVSRGMFAMLINQRGALGRKKARLAGMPEEAGEEQIEFEDLFGHWMQSCPVRE